MLRSARYSWPDAKSSHLKLMWGPAEPTEGFKRLISNDLNTSAGVILISAEEKQKRSSITRQ